MDARQRLATQIQRSRESLVGLDALSDAQLDALHALIADTLAREHHALDADWQRALPAPLRWLLFAGWRRT